MDQMEVRADQDLKEILMNDVDKVINKKLIK